MNKVALFDVCHTLVSVTTITDFVKHVLLSRKENPYFKIHSFVIHYIYKVLRKIGLISSESYRKHLPLLFKGYKKDEIVILADKYVTRLQQYVKPAIIDQLKKLQSEGYRVLLVSAAFDAYLESFAQSLGVELVCTRLSLNNNIYTGSIDGIDCIGDGKVQKLFQFLNKNDIDWVPSVAFGDSFSDVPFMSLVGTQYAVDPTPELFEYAKNNNWEIVTTK